MHCLGGPLLSYLAVSEFKKKKGKKKKKEKKNMLEKKMTSRK